jgi:PilZ domain
LHRPEPEIERRRWSRLPLSIPVFVRARGEDGKDFLEFATAVNVSAGGALVVVRRSLPPAARVLLEVPTPPSPALAPRPKSSRVLRARILRVTHAEGYYLMGLKFLRPLVADSRNGISRRRKVASLV